MSTPTASPYRGQGLFIGTTSTRVDNLRVPPRDFDAPSGLGILLTIATLVPAAHDALDPDEFEARIAWHAARVAREEREYCRLNRHGEREPAHAKGRYPEAKNRALELDWKTCRCAACSCRLFGESMVGTEGLPSYTGFVAGRVKDRPYCAECLATIAGRIPK